MNKHIDIRRRLKNSVEDVSTTMKCVFRRCEVENVSGHHPVRGFVEVSVRLRV